MSSIEKIVDAFVVDEWSSIARLYGAVVQFARVYKGQISALVAYLLSALFSLPVKKVWLFNLIMQRCRLMHWRILTIKEINYL